jgi:hypothetical protein
LKASLHLHYTVKTKNKGEYNMKNWKSIITILGLLPGLILLTACASIISKSQYPVSINSTPDEATVTITSRNGNTVFKGRTPTSVTLKANRGFFMPADYLLTFEKEGCEKFTTSLSSGLDVWYIGNAIFGGLIGFLIVDPATGAMWKLQDSVHANLSNTISSNEKAPQLKIMNLADIPDQWKDKLVKIH